MNLKIKLLIATLVIAVITLVSIIVYKQIEISKRQKAIEESIILQKNLTNDLVRSMSQYATADQIKSYLKENKVDLTAIQNDIAKLHAKIDSVNTVVVGSLGYDWHNLPSDEKKPVISEPTTTKVNCGDKVIDCLKDPNNYLSSQQSLKLNEKFKDVTVPFGKATFDGSKNEPWTLSVFGRNYKLITVSATDENSRVVNYNQFAINVDGTDYKIPISQAVTQQVFPDPIFRFWSPRLYLGADTGFNFTQTQFEYGPSLNLSIMNYGRYVQTPDLSVLELGLGAGANTNTMYFVLTPIAYNVGKHFPFIMNTYLAPSLQVSPKGDLAGMIGLRLGL